MAKFQCNFTTKKCPATKLSTGLGI